MDTISNQSIPYERSYHSIMQLFGGLVVGLGVILTVMGSFSLFSSWRTVGGSHYYWTAFIGLPLIALGSAVTQSENLRSVDVSLAGDNTTRLPVDDITYEVAKACMRCHATNPTSANFCNQCGSSLKASNCKSCGAKINHNARFCTHCGKSLVF
jgi:ribosomal protein L40E